MDREQIEMHINDLQRQLDNPDNLGRKRPDGTYYFPRTRRARWKIMMTYMELLDDGTKDE